MRCSEHRRGCLARAVIPANGDVKDIRVTRAHNHPPDLLAVETRRFKRALYECARKEPITTSIKTVYEKVAKT